MTKNEFSELSSEFRRKVVLTVKKFMVAGKIAATAAISAQLRVIMGAAPEDELPEDLFEYLPKAIEIHEQPDPNQLQLLITTSVPTKVDGAFQYTRAGSVDIKIVARVFPNEILFMSCSKLNEFRKAQTYYYPSHKAFNSSNRDSNFDSLLPTFARTKTVPRMPATTPVAKTATPEKENTTDATIE